MEINEWILKNEKLAAMMKVYAAEIDRLERFRALVREKPMPESEINFTLIQNINKKISKAKKDFRIWNDAYRKEEDERADRDETADIYIPEIKERCKEIENIFLRTNITPLSRLW